MCVAAAAVAIRKLALHGWEKHEKYVRANIFLLTILNSSSQSGEPSGHNSIQYRRALLSHSVTVTGKFFKCKKGIRKPVINGSLPKYFPLQSEGHKFASKAEFSFLLLRYYLNHHIL